MYINIHIIYKSYIQIPKKPLQYLFFDSELWMHADVDAMFFRLVAWHTDTIRSRLPQLSCSWAQLDQGSSKAFVEICYVTRDAPYPSQRSCLATIQSLSSLLPVTAMKTCREMLPFATSASWRSLLISGTSKSSSNSFALHGLVIQYIHAGPDISQCLVENMFLLPCLCRAILCFWFFFFFGWGTWCSRYCGCWLWSFWSNRCWCRCRWRCCCWRWRCCCWRWWGCRRWWRCCCRRWRCCWWRWCFCCRWWCGWRGCCWCRWCCRCWFGGCRLWNFLCFWHSWRHAGWHWGRRRGHRGWGLHGGWQRFGGRRGSWSFLNSESTWRNHQHGSSRLKTLKSRFKLATVVELDLSSHSICISDISCCNLLTMTSQWFHPKLFNQTILVQKIKQK